MLGKRTIRNVIAGGATAALVVAGLAVASAPAGAAKVTITNATAAQIDCTITAKAKINPKLKNNWVQADHAGDPEPAVVALPDTKFATDGPNFISAKSKSVSCTGFATDGVNVATVTGIKITLVSGTQAVDNPPLQDDNTCQGLLEGTAPEDVAATYSTDIKFKTQGGKGTAKLANATTSGQTIEPAGIGFAVSGGTVGGSLAGGNGITQANLSDGGVLAAIAAPAATSTAPTPDRTCQANLKLKTKTKKGVTTTTAKFKKPKGLKKIAVGYSFVDGSPSTVCLRVGSTCP